MSAQGQGTTSTPPPEPKPGQDALSYLRTLQRWLKKTQALPGSGMTSTQTGSGRTFNVKLTQQPQTYLYAEHPWQLFQAEGDIPGLNVSMIPGMVSGISETNLNPLNLNVMFNTIAFPDGATTIVWVKVSLKLVEWSSVQKVWVIESAVVETGTALPADTLDIANQTDGNVFVEIGKVTTEAGEVTLIEQILFTPLTYLLPLVFFFDDEEGCPGDHDPFLRLGLTTNEPYWDCGVECPEDEEEEEEEEGPE